MSEIKLSTDTIRYIALFESITGARAKDCFIDEDKVIFVVKNGDMGIAIGKGGEHINKVRKVINKNIEIIEYFEDPIEFMRNAFYPISLKNINIVLKDNKRIAYVEVPTKEKGLAIGRNGKNIEKVKKLSYRHHNISDVIIQ